MIIRSDSEPVFVLDDVTCIPSDIRERLARYEEAVADYECLDQMLDGVRAFREIAEELDHRVRRGKVRAFHCTKEREPGYFKAHGLRTLSMQEHHDDFDELVSKECPHLRERFREALGDFRESYGGRREGMIWFCMSRHLAMTSGTQWFFRYFGGEAIYFSVEERDTDCARFLQDFGHPVVVEVEIEAREFNTYQAPPAFARDLLSHWAAGFAGDEFYIDSIEAHLTRDVRPHEIVGVHPVNRP